MAKRQWSFSLEGKVHTVEVRYGFLSGKKAIWVDGVLQQEAALTRDLANLGGSYVFTLDGHNCAVMIRSDGFTFSCDLLVGGRRLEPGEDLEPPEEDGRAREVVGKRGPYRQAGPVTERDVAREARKWVVGDLLAQVFAVAIPLLPLYARQHGDPSHAVSAVAILVATVAGFVLALFRTPDVHMDLPALPFGPPSPKTSPDLRSQYDAALLRLSRKWAMLGLVLPLLALALAEWLPMGEIAPYRGGNPSSRADLYGFLLVVAALQMLLTWASCWGWQLLHIVRHSHPPSK